MTSNLLETWVNQHTDSLYSWAFYKVSDSELAKDLVRDTFLAAAEKVESFKGNWQSDDEQNVLDEADFQEVMQKCMGALPEKWNAAIKLKYMTEKKSEDICQELGITTSNFWQIVHRAKLQLRDCIDTNWHSN